MRPDRINSLSEGILWELVGRSWESCDAAWGCFKKGVDLLPNEDKCFGPPWPVGMCLHVAFVVPFPNATAFFNGASCPLILNPSLGAVMAIAVSCVSAALFLANSPTKETRSEVVFSHKNEKHKNKANIMIGNLGTWNAHDMPSDGRDCVVIVRSWRFSHLTVDAYVIQFDQKRGGQYDKLTFF